MSDWAFTAAVCAAFAAAGFEWTGALAPSAPRVPRLGLAYLVGTALVTLAMMLIALVGAPVNRLTVVLAFVLAAASGRWAAGRRAGSVPRDRPALGGPLAVALLALAAVPLVDGLIEVVRRGPITEGDYLHAWGLRGLWELAEHSMRFHGHTGPNLFYPLEISNVNGATWVMLGHVNDSVVRLPQALYGVALAPVMWWLLQLLALPPAGAALGVALTVSTPQFVDHMTKGLADLAVAAYVTVAALAAALWVRRGGAELAALSGVSAGAAAWTKLEGAPTALVLLATVMVIRRRVRSPGVWTWIAWFAVFTVPWQVFMRVYGIQLNRSHFKRLYLNLPWIVDHVAQNLANTARWGLFWPLCLAVIALTAPLWWRTPHRLLAAFVLPNLAFTLIAYVTHYRAGVAASVHATAGRLYLHLAPGVAAMTAAGACAAYAAASEALDRRVARSRAPSRWPRGRPRPTRPIRR